MSDIDHSRMIPLHIADQAVAACEKEIAALKAEVERLESRDVVRATAIYGLHQTIKERDAEVERLIKAGDALAETLESAGFDSAMDFWNAAKEGKQP